MSSKNLYKIIVLMFVAIVVMATLLSKSCDREKDTGAMLSAVQDSLYQVRDSHGRQTSTIEAYVGSIKLLKDELHSEKETNKRLQATVRQFGNKVVTTASIDLITNNNASGATTVLPKDTVAKDGVKYVYPVYVDTIVKPWVSYTVRADKDSTHVSSVTKQAMDVSFIEFKSTNVFGKDTTRRSGLKTLFDPPKINLRVNLQNPDSGVTDEHGFVKEGKKKHTGWKFIAGVLSLEGLRILLIGKP